MRNRQEGATVPEALIRTLLVEDHEISRLGLKKILEHMPEICVVGEVADGILAVATAIELRPDLVLMDIGLPGMDGIEATKAIKKVLATKVIVITSHDNSDDVFAGLSAGADAYCLKGISASQLENAIHSVMDDAMWLDPGIAQQVVQAVVRDSRAQLSHSGSQANVFHLSERELEVLSLLVNGATNQQMASRLFLSPETIKTHMRRVMEKLRVSDRTQAAVKAVKQGLVT
jgi:NarL family two-component system response regulator LiaR